VALGGAGRPGDYLYGSDILDDQWLGMWGIFRVESTMKDDLQPLPTAKQKDKVKEKEWPALSPGQRLNSKPPTAVNTCPADAPIRNYDIVALQKRITYNAAKDVYDPDGMLFVLAEDEAAAVAGTKPDEPLFIRANAGDCLLVKLTNKLPTSGLVNHEHDAPLAEPVDDFPRSHRVSLHAAMLDYDVTRADGATVGYNLDQTVAPGSSISAYWYVPKFLEGATLPLTDLADRRGHRHHGLHGGLMVEPEGSTWHDPQTGAEIKTGAQAVIRWQDADGNARARREFVVDWEDGLNLWHAGAPMPEASDRVVEPHELRNRAVNFRTEPFPLRYPANGDPASVMSSAVHGDPVTPLFQAYVGDPVALRILQSSDRGRAHNFILSGHEWRAHTNDDRSQIRSSRPLLVPTQGGTWHLLGGAGGTTGQSGDFLYRDGLVPNQTNAGLWGLLRVHDSRTENLLPLTPDPTEPPQPSEPPPPDEPSESSEPTKPGRGRK
jgi:manganese oxidase